MLELTQETIEQIKAVIIPEIFGAADDIMRAYEQGTKSDGRNFFDNYFVGCGCWCNLYNRLDEKLEKHSFFTKKTSKKVMTISCPNGDNHITFYIFRVDEENRVPCAGKSVKLFLQEQFFLSDEIQTTIANSRSSVYTIGYDISIVNGLGKITFDMLSSTSKKRFQSTMLYTFTDVQPASKIERLPQEGIKSPTVTREDLAKQPKSARK